MDKKNLGSKTEIEFFSKVQNIGLVLSIISSAFPLVFLTSAIFLIKDVTSNSRLLSDVLLDHFALYGGKESFQFVMIATAAICFLFSLFSILQAVQFRSRFSNRNSTIIYLLRMKSKIAISFGIIGLIPSIMFLIFMIAYIQYI